MLDTLSGLEAELRGAVIIGAAGEVLAFTAEDTEWPQAAVRLLEALNASGSEQLDSSHIATEEAEVFVVTEGDLALVAATERFVLASLTSFDMRMSLRDLAATDA